MPEKIGTMLQTRLETAREYDIFDINIFLKDEPAQRAINTFDSEAPSVTDKEDVINRIQQQSAQSQENLVTFLNDSAFQPGFSDFEVSVPQVSAIMPFWINNSVGTKVTRNILESILERDDVLQVELARYAPLEELLDNKVEDKFAPRYFNLKDEFALDDQTAQPTWSVERVNAPLLWQMNINGDGILAAVLDTGVNYSHPDLVNRMWDGGAEFPFHGFDFESGDNNPMDIQGHGTCCAGIVAGDGTSGKKTGIAPGTQIIAVKVGGEERNFWRGFEFAIARRVHVISMSMSWKFPSNPDYPGWRRICETVLAAGILHANSTGNQGNDLVQYPIPYNAATPGNCPPPRLHSLQTTVGGITSVISCGNTNVSDNLSTSSARGPAAWERAPYTDYPFANGIQLGLIKPDICAPGDGTISCNVAVSSASNAYTSFGGTSGATPHVAGCLALLAHACVKSAKPIVPARIQEAIEETAVKISGQTKKKENHYGTGRIDVFAAYRYGTNKGWW